MGEVDQFFSVIVRKAFYSKFVTGIYTRKPQWKPYRGSFSLMNVNSLVELHEWIKQEIPDPYGLFNFQSTQGFKNLGFVENNRGGISIKDNRSPIARRFKKKSERKLIREW